MDAITLLRDDHKTVEQLFKRFEKAGDRAHVEKRQIVDRIIEELSVHAAIEEQVFYPVARSTVPDTEDIALESLEEHHIVKWLLSELADLDPSHERFDAKVTVLIENVRHHVEEEENDFFPKVRNELGRTALADLGEALAEAKKSAPTHPHPRSPDVPPGNAVVGAIAGVVDRVGDNISGIAQGGVTAAQDLIARITGSKKPKVSPTGSSLARTRADKVRRAASTATDGVQQTARSAKSGATSTARAASSGAKGTATTAKKSARATATTAKRATATTARTAKASTKRTAGTAKRAASKTLASATRAR
ncbi:MAG: hemerythrin domain-containing protein [Acidimicrobiia bacterium]